MTLRSLTRRGFLASLLPAVASDTERTISLHARIDVLRRGLERVKRLAEAEAGLWRERGGPPILPPEGSVWRQFWDIADRALWGTRR